MCKVIFVYTSKTGQYDVLSVEPFKDWPMLWHHKWLVMKSVWCVFPIVLKQISVCVFVLNCGHICEPQKQHLITLLMI